MTLQNFAKISFPHPKAKQYAGHFPCNLLCNHICIASISNVLQVTATYCIKRNWRVFSTFVPGVSLHLNYFCTCCNVTPSHALNARTKKDHETWTAFWPNLVHKNVKTYATVLLLWQELEPGPLYAESSSLGLFAVVKQDVPTGSFKRLFQENNKWYK